MIARMTHRMTREWNSGRLTVLQLPMETIWAPLIHQRTITTTTVSPGTQSALKGYPVDANGKPIEPDMNSCCGNGCVDCVWVQYSEALSEWQAIKQMEKIAEQKKKKEQEQLTKSNATSAAKPSMVTTSDGHDKGSTG